jgi:succinoglycan biosynthesis transport protein ExoP
MDQRSLYLLRQAITAIFKRWRLVALVLATIVVPFNFFNFLIRQPVYNARAKVMITKDRAYAEVSPLERERAVSDLPNEMVVNSELQLIRSRDLMRRLHDELETQSATNPEGAFPVPTVVQLEQRIGAARKPQSNVVEVSYRSSDPDFAIHVVNTLVGLYSRYHIETHKALGALAFFDKETQTAKESFVNADLELERFDAAHGLTSVATEKDNMLRQRAQLEADLRRTEAQVTELTTKVAAVEAELEYIPEQEAVETEMVPNPLLGYLRQNMARLEMERERLLQLYTPQHRLVVDVETELAAIRSQVAGQEGTVVGRKKMSQTPTRRRLQEDLLSSQAELGALEARRAMLAERITDYEGKIRVLHAKHYEVMRLRRDREEAKKKYDAVLGKLNEVRVSEAMDLAGLSNISIIEAAAAPLEREADYRMVTLALTTFLALFLGISAAVVVELINPVMNSDLDVRHHLDLPVLAAIPAAVGPGGPGGNLNFQGNNLQDNQQYNQGNQQGNNTSGYRVGNARRTGNRGNGGNGGGGRNV